MTSENIDLRNPRVCVWLDSFENIIKWPY